MTMTSPRPFDRATQAKLDRVLARQANRDRLKHIKEAIAQIETDLEAVIKQRRRSFSSADFIEERWLREIQIVSADLEILEI
jgi:hypothetical protein